MGYLSGYFCSQLNLCPGPPDFAWFLSPFLAGVQIFVDSRTPVMSLSTQQRSAVCMKPWCHPPHAPLTHDGNRGLDVTHWGHRPVGTYHLRH
jgi:hypothetical protein